MGQSHPKPEPNQCRFKCQLDYPSTNLDRHSPDASKISLGFAGHTGYIEGMHHCTTTDAMHRKMCHFSGRVQGVGFRYTVQNLAMQYNVHGYVKNLPDGRVELVMEGPDQEMADLLGEVQRKMNNFIRGVNQMVIPATGEFDQFFIRH
jgi:acylphosphatase